MSLTMEDLEHVIKLAHLEVDPAEKEKYLKQLTNILGYMEQLNELDLSNIDPSSYASDRGTFLREDEVKQSEDLLLEKNAPKWENGCFRVPKII